MSDLSLRSSPSAVRNAPAIAAVLADQLKPGMRVVEVGCGTGQHAACMVDQIADMTWQPTDVVPETETIMAWRERAQNAACILPPRALDVSAPEHWVALDRFDALYSANTLHIMPWASCEHLFAGAARVIRAGGLMCIYGPFHDGDRPTSDSNERFDRELRAQPGGMGIRDLQRVRALAASCDWLEYAHYHMPANNQMLIWRRAET